MGLAKFYTRDIQERIQKYNEIRMYRNVCVHVSKWQLDFRIWMCVHVCKMLETKITSG